MIKPRFLPCLWKYLTEYKPEILIGIIVIVSILIVVLITNKKRKHKWLENFQIKENGDYIAEQKRMENIKDLEYLRVKKQLWKEKDKYNTSSIKNEHLPLSESVRYGDEMVKNWMNSLKNDANRKLRESRKEYEKYKKTGKTIYLQQACNKLFSAVENRLMVKYKIRKRSYKALYNLVRKSQKDRILLQLAKDLHVFYYNGPLDITLYEAENKYNDVYKMVIEW